MENQRNTSPIEARLLELHSALKKTWGTDYRRLAGLLRHLAESSWVSPSTLIAESGLSHRAVTDLLRLLDPFLEKDDQKVRLRPDAAAPFAAQFAGEENPLIPYPDPRETAARTHPMLVSMTRILETAPRSDRHLDHVSATSVTCVKRAMYLDQGKPPFTRQPHSGTVAVNLHPHYGSYLPRALLIAAARRLIICAPDRDLHRLFLSDRDDSLRPLVESVYQQIELVRGHGQRPGVAVLERLPAPASSPLHFVLRYIADHRRAKLGNAWREALISWSSTHDGIRLTKNQAREQIRRSGFPLPQLQNFLPELPIAGLQALIDALPRSLEPVAPPSAGQPDEE